MNDFASAAARLARLWHDLANPLSVVLAEVQLLLLDADRLPEETVAGLRNIEAAATRMQVILRGIPSSPP